jgi:putative ATPase
MRPRTLDEYVGQDHIVGPGRLLRRAIEADRLGSLLFHGPPGTGKTTLAQVIAGSTRAHFTAINAVLAGVKDLRKAVAEATERRSLLGKRTILFVDEVHRFNKAQQDALLPWVENGTVILIGATTENPFFEVNQALVSRSRIFRLLPLDAAALGKVVDQTLADKDRGYGFKKVEIEEGARAHLIDVASGDARALLNALELAVETTAPDEAGVVRIPLEVAEESIQQRAVLYDKSGDGHYDTVSAFIKSLRGSDPDAALYWLARMIYAGEDPRFLFRRMIIAASEEVGLADTGVLRAVLDCAAAFDRVGMPEGRFHLSQATLALATAPKSNSTMGLFDALAAVKRESADDVPRHLKDASRDAEATGQGEGYLYPHAYRDHWVAQQYLPASLRGRVFYKPSDCGAEAAVAETVARRREAQLAAMVEVGEERLTYGKDQPRVARWLERTASEAGARLEALRDVVFEAAECKRHHLVLDLAARTGLLTFEAVRQAPEGGVWARVDPGQQREALVALAKRLPQMRRPTVLGDEPTELAFDRVVGRDLPGGTPDALVAALRGVRLSAEGRVVVVQTMARHTMRLASELSEALGELGQRFAEAEDALYTDAADPRTAWDVADLEAALTDDGWQATVRPVATTHEVLVDGVVLERWFADREGSYGDRLRARLGEEAVTQICKVANLRLRNRTLGWRSVAALVVAGRS